MIITDKRRNSFIVMMEDKINKTKRRGNGIDNFFLNRLIYWIEGKHPWLGWGVTGGVFSGLILLFIISRIRS